MISFWESDDSTLLETVRSTAGQLVAYSAGNLHLKEKLQPQTGEAYVQIANNAGAGLRDEMSSMCLSVVSGYVFVIVSVGWLTCKHIPFVILLWQTIGCCLYGSMRLSLLCVVACVLRWFAAPFPGIPLCSGAGLRLDMRRFDVD